MLFKTHLSCTRKNNINISKYPKKFKNMKKVSIITIIALFIVAPVAAQGKKMIDEKRDKNCTIIAVSKVSRATDKLIETYRKLLTPVGNSVCTSSTGTISASNTMPLSYYGGNSTNGTISFSSFVEGADLFRTVFGSKQSEYDYYGVCAPKPIVWDASPNGVNHIFAAKLVTIQNFVAAGANAEFLKITGVPIVDIASIDCLKIEEANGYAAATENANYVNQQSSKGILVKVTLKTGEQQLCYLINNYDTSGTLKWKE